MRTVLKIPAAIAMCLLALVIAVSSLMLLVCRFVCWFLCALACIGGAVLFFTKHVDGGIAFLFIAFLVSPYGLPALGAWLLFRLNALRYSLKTFIYE